jgi:hypothetical protein
MGEAAGDRASRGAWGRPAWTGRKNQWFSRSARFRPIARKWWCPSGRRWPPPETFSEEELLADGGPSSFHPGIDRFMWRTRIPATETNSRGFVVVINVIRNCRKGVHPISQCHPSPRLRRRLQKKAKLLPAKRLERGRSSGYLAHIHRNSWANFGFTLAGSCTLAPALTACIW